MSASTRTRKKKAPSVSSVEQVTAPSDVMPDTPLRVSLADLWAMRLAQAEKKTAEAEMEAARMSRLYILAKLDPKGLVLGIEKKLEAAQKAAEAAENRSLIAKKRMEHALGRPLTGVAIDPDSGEVQLP